MLTGLGLGAGLVACDEEKCGVHDGDSCKHCGHEYIMSWAIDEGNVSDEEKGRIAAWGGALGRVLLLGAKRLEALGRGTSGALVQLGVRIAELDGDVSEAFFVVTHSL